MGRKIHKDVYNFAEVNDIDLKEIKGTGQNGIVLKRDLVKFIEARDNAKAETIEAVVIPEFNYDEILEVNPKAEMVKTKLRLYQMTHSKSKGDYESWNLILDFNQIGEIDGKLLAKFVASKVHEMTVLFEASGVKSSFSTSKPLWFEVNNGRQKLDFNLSLASNWKIFVKGKRGKHILKESQLISTIETLYRANAIVTSSKDANIFKLGSVKAVKRLKVASSN